MPTLYDALCIDDFRHIAQSTEEVEAIESESQAPMEERLRQTSVDHKTEVVHTGIAISCALIKFEVGLQRKTCWESDLCIQSVGDVETIDSSERGAFGSGVPVSNTDAPIEDMAAHLGVQAQLLAQRKVAHGVALRNVIHAVAEVGFGLSGEECLLLGIKRRLRKKTDGAMPVAIHIAWHEGAHTRLGIIYLAMCNCVARRFPKSGEP